MAREERDEHGNLLEPIVPIVLATGIPEFPGYFRYIKGDKVLATPAARGGVKGRKMPPGTGRRTDLERKRAAAKAAEEATECEFDAAMNREIRKAYP